VIGKGPNANQKELDDKDQKNSALPTSNQRKKASQARKLRTISLSKNKDKENFQL